MHPMADGPADLQDVWARLLTLFAHQRDAMFAVLGRHDIMPSHGHALAALAGGPRRMGELAVDLACDASYITAIVDRLEEAGLAERRPNPVDRRAKDIVLTGRGRKVAATVNATMVTPPPEFERLSAAERAALSKILAKVVADAELVDPFQPHRRD
jgi:DNA-binding MarR family transcriptional regulator